MALPFDVDGTYVNDPTVLYSAGELRLADAALVAQAGIANGLAVSVDGSDTVTVTAGSVVISGESAVAGTGIYRAGIGAAQSGALTARNGTNARIDLVVFRQLDSDVVPAHAAKKAQVAIIAGTPSATPAAPTLPSMAVELARITVPATGGGAATVDSSFRTYAAAVFGSQGGWTDLSLGSGWANLSGTEKTQAIKRWGQVTIAIAATKANYNANEVIATLPAAMFSPTDSGRTRIRIVGQYNGAARFASYLPGTGQVVSDTAQTGGFLGSVSFPAVTA